MKRIFLLSGILGFVVGVAWGVVVWAGRGDCDMSCTIYFGLSRGAVGFVIGVASGLLSDVATRGLHDGAPRRSPDEPGEQQPE